MARFLLELRTEEIPAAALPGARSQLERGFREGLEAAGYTGFEVRALSTARRLVVEVEGLPERQPHRTETVTGPPVRVAFAEDGTPTRAAEGFARKVGLAVERLERVTTPRGEYLAATVHHPGRATAEVVAEVAGRVVPGLRFPKTMRWGLGRYQFGRPVHGVVALLDAVVVPLELFGHAAGRTTSGHRVVAPGPVEIPGAAAYEPALAAAGVVVDPGVRRERLEALADRLAAEVGCRVHPDPELVAEHVELVEHPGLVRGRIDPRFLELPREVVVTTLRHHQKCLVLEREDGALAPYFLAVIDRPDDPEGLIVQGNEWVIGARLADAAFFFAEDRRRRLEELVGGLERIEFHRRLGSLGGKADRIGRLAAALAASAGLELDGKTVARAARLVKADLLTHMVGEFPELEGVMGGHYLRLEGEPEAVWTAARDHYLPVGFEGELPVSELGRVLAAADRLDTLAGLFGVGEVPSGSRDPFALRRAAQALVRLVAESGWRVPVSRLVERAVGLYGERLEAPPEEVTRRVLDFLADRVRRYLTDVVGVAGDTADAVMAVGWDDLPGAVSRARALEAVRRRPEFGSLALAFKRVRNIVGRAGAGEPDPAGFSEPAERELHAALGRLRARLDELVPAGELEAAFIEAGTVAPVLDRFFDEVLVMAEDERVRANRIALLAAVGRELGRLADLSRLQVEGG